MKKVIVFFAICFFIGSGYGLGATKYLDLTWAEFLAGSYKGSANLLKYVEVHDWFRYIPVHFPEQTGVVTSLKAWLGDTSTLYTIRAKLYRINLGTGNKELVFQINTGTVQAVGKRGYTTIDLKTPGASIIDNENYGWVLLIEGDNDSVTTDLLKFFGARITYDAI